MVQESNSKIVSGRTNFEQYFYDEDVTLSSTFEKILSIDLININVSMFQFINNGSVINDERAHYKIYASAKEDVDLENADPENEDEWINLLSPALYNHNAFRDVRAGRREADDLTIDPWRYLIMMARSTNGTPSIKVWHRGIG